MAKCKWTTLSTGNFGTSCGYITHWKIPELDFYNFCPFCGKELEIKIETSDNSINNKKSEK